jgi:hypothetical protein
MNWTRDQQLAVLRLYFRLPFGKLHRANPEIVALAEALGRTPSSVSMKACNFASLDPSITSTGRKGLAGTSRADRELWAEFQADSERVADEAEGVVEGLALGRAEQGAALRSAPWQPEAPVGPTEVQRLVRARRVQAFFRRAVLVSYRGACAISGLRERSLLRASHILPWSTHPTRRADPTNGLCLNALFDAAFDRGLITIDEDLRLVVSNRLKEAAGEARLSCSIAEAHGQALHLPERQLPDRAALEHHRTKVYRE